MDRPSYALRARRRPIALAILLTLLLAACDPGGPVASPGLTPLPDGTPTAGPISGGTEPPDPIGTPFVAPWPAGWDDAFCAAFDELVVTQELAVDIGRALDEDDRADARALTAELAESATTTRTLLEQVPEWAADEPLREDIGALLDLADEMALRYDRHLNEGRAPALRRAREAGAQMPDAVEPILDRLARLSEQGLTCPGTAFDLETPAAE